MKKTLLNALLCAVAGMCFVPFACAQHSLTLFTDQPESPLTVDAGSDLRFDGNAVRLGGEPTARGGHGDYSYRWEPAEYLDDPTLPNPRIIRLDRSVTFRLRVQDRGRSCEKTAEVFVSAPHADADGAAPEVTAFPNPFSDAVTFRANAGIELLTVTDLAGKHIAQKRPADAPTFRFEAGHLPPGIYLFTIRFSDGSTIVEKLCKVY